ncbi:hypothetical protein AABB24_006956, partial [Solanum stoloniferum]
FLSTFFHQGPAPIELFSPYYYSFLNLFLSSPLPKPKVINFTTSNQELIMADQQVSSYMNGSSKKKNNISRKCASLIKEQRARIYILRRCATMLLCWYIQGDE